MSAAYSVIPSLLLIGFAGAAPMLFPQATQGLASWLVRFGALIIQL